MGFSKKGILKKFQAIHLKTPVLKSVICLSVISQRSFIHLFKPSFVRKMDKIHNFAFFKYNSEFSYFQVFDFAL